MKNKYIIIIILMLFFSSPLSRVCARAEFSLRREVELWQKRTKERERFL